MSPALALGQAVHAVLEGLSTLPVDQRFSTPLLTLFNQEWEKVAGKKGGFWDKETEMKYKQRGEEMLKRVQQNPGPLAKKAVKIKQDLPHYWLSEEDNIILCGKIDWLEYNEEDDSVHIIDFKTGRTNKEKDDSLQLLIYSLLVNNTQHRKVSGASYWYLEQDGGLVEKELPGLEEAHEKVLKAAKQIKTARQLESFKCPHGEEGCFACQPFEKVLAGEAEYVGVGGYGADTYILPKKDLTTSLEDNSEIL